MGRRKPINAGLPEGWPPKPVLAGLGALVVVGLIVASVLAGNGGGPEETAATPAPAVESGGDEAGVQELGSPGFATNNTTRIGGADPASIAAAAALAVYPSTVASQRPPMVTFVAEEDWAGAIAASVLMAEPVRAPLLISAPGEVPGVTAEALEALAPTGEGRAGGATATVVGDATPPAGLRAETVAAGNGAEEAAAIAALRDRLFGSPPAHVVVAPAAQPRLAMPAAAWAARSGDPVLFAEPDKLPKATERALKRYQGVPAYVLGPSSAVSSEVLREVARASGGKVSRVSGEEPVSNALAFARYHDGSFGWNVNDPGHGFVLARYDQPVVAGAVAPLSGSGTWGPLLLTDGPTKLPAELREYFLDVKPGYTDNPTRAFYNHVWVIGDQEAIDVNQQAEVNELAELAKIGGGE